MEEAQEKIHASMHWIFWGACCNYRFLGSQDTVFVRIGVKPGSMHFKYASQVILIEAAQASHFEKYFTTSKW